MTREEAIKWQEAFKKTYGNFPPEAAAACDIAIEALKEPERKWIPVSYHEPIEEDGEDTQYGFILDCKLPDEGQEILVSSHGNVSIDECCYDDGGWYLDSYGDWLNVDAWQPLPEPYKAGEQE